jgi:hypothetical protein
MWRTAAKFLVGTIAGSMLWWYCTPAYNDAIAQIAVRILHVDPRLHDIVATPQERWIFVESFSASIGTATIPADQLTYNVILFIAIVLATEGALFRPRKLRAVAIAALILATTHVATFAIATEAIYATSAASGDRWGAIETNIWYYAVMFLRLVGMLGIAFGCWIFVRTHGEDAARVRQKAKGRREK